jgi:hypothetical protein
MKATASWMNRPARYGIRAVVVLALAGCAGAPRQPAPQVEAAPGDTCQMDCYAWLRYSLSSALAAQRTHLCSCLGPGPAGRAATLQVLISAEGVTGARVVARTTDAAAARCMVRRAGRATEGWLKLKPGWYRAGGVWSQQRLASSWRKTHAPIEYDWEGLTCSPAEAATDPGEPLLPASWIRAHPDGLACEVFQCAPSARCCAPRNVSWQFRLVQGRSSPR